MYPENQRKEMPGWQCLEVDWNRSVGHEMVRRKEGRAMCALFLGLEVLVWVVYLR